MAAKIVDQATAYEEFEPLCKWQRKEDQDILEIHLHELKKEQLNVQISNAGILKISGERPLDASKHTKFYKEVLFPINKYDHRAVHAKFASGILTITMPKLKTSAHETDRKAPPPPKLDQAPKPSPAAIEAPQVGGGAKEQKPTPGGSSPTECRLESRRTATMGVRLAKSAVSLAATAALVAVLVAYAVYMYRSTAEIDD